MLKKNQKIAFQGVFGANSDIACRQMFPKMEPFPCKTFSEAFSSVITGKASYAMIPIENNLAGRVADIHYLLPESNLYIIGEYFLAVHFHLMGLHGAQKEDIKTVHSHVHALGQCQNFIQKNNWIPVVSLDTAGAAKELSQNHNSSQAVLAPELASTLYNLKILERNVEDAAYNRTRFIILSSKPKKTLRLNKKQSFITSFIFNVKNQPAALYKVLSGFATNNVNITKLESYQLGGKFAATQFYADIVGHPNDYNVGCAFEEASFFSQNIRILGTYISDPKRHLYI